MKLNREHKVSIHVLIQLGILVIPVGVFFLWGMHGAAREMNKPHHGDPMLGVAIFSAFMYMCWIAYLLLNSIPLHLKKLYALRNANLVMAAIAITALLIWRYNMMS